jgi:hypothetical protein
MTRTPEAAANDHVLALTHKLHFARRTCKDFGAICSACCCGELSIGA